MKFLSRLLLNATAVLCGGARGFHLRVYPKGMGTEVPQTGAGVPQKVKQFSDIVYRFPLQKRSKCENFAQLSTS